jgi:hypothetical protein
MQCPCDVTGPLCGTLAHGTAAYAGGDRNRNRTAGVCSAHLVEDPG